MNGCKYCNNELTICGFCDPSSPMFGKEPKPQKSILEFSIFKDMAGYWIKEAAELVSTLKNKTPSTEHPSETFDRMTREGYKLDLITGKYYKEGK